MGKRRNKRNKGKINRSGLKLKVTVLLVLLVCLLVSFFFAPKIETALGLNSQFNKNQTTAEKVYNSNSFVSFIDVGQGSSAFIKLPDGKNILIDGGNTEYGDDVAEFLNDRGVTTIDYMIATHSDSDHIGGLNYVLQEFEVKNIYRPFQICGTGTSANNFVPYEDEDLGGFYEKFIKNGDVDKVSRVTSEVYKTFITKIYSETYYENGATKESTVTVFYDGLKIEGENYSLEFFAPIIRSKNYDLEIFSSKTSGYATVGYGVSRANDNSAICLLSCMGFKYLFTGDAPSSEYGKDSDNFEELDFVKSLTNSEKILLSNIDVYVVGHHGSKYSSSKMLLSLINPRFAVISVGKGNTYGHPHEETIQRISATSNLEQDYLQRTDKSGTITFAKIDGKLLYALEVQTSESGFKISWYVLGSVIYVFVAVFVLSIRFKKPRKNQKHWQLYQKGLL